MREYLKYCPDSGQIHWRKDRVQIPGMPAQIRSGDKAGWMGKTYMYITFNNEAWLSHRVAWFLFYGTQPPPIIDHKDADPTNNKISNLRKLNHTGNLLNVTKKTSGKSGIRGVHFDKRRGSWQAFINLNKKRHFIYYGHDFFEACCARKSAESAYWSHQTQFAT
jgi:hypothetical protein